MADRSHEYGLYRTGCDRLGQPAVSESEFETRWADFEAYAERLKAADVAGTLPDVEAVDRAEMQRRVRDDPFVRALLVGMAENGG
jgi:hypothetical protein